MSDDPQSSFPFGPALRAVGVFALIGMVATVAGVAWVVWRAAAYVAGLSG